MKIIIDALNVKINGSTGFDGQYIVDNIITTDYCNVVHLSTRAGEFVLKFLNYHEFLKEENHTAWQKTFFAESEKLGTFDHLHDRKHRLLVPRVYYYDRNAVIHFSDTCQSYFSPLLIIEYISGTRIYDLNGRFPRRFFSDLCSSLEYFNQRGFFHMDLSAGNIIVGYDGCVWLIDFTGAFIYQNGAFLCKEYKNSHIRKKEYMSLHIAGLARHGCEVFQAEMLLDLFKKNCCYGLGDCESGRLCEVYDRVLKADTPLLQLKNEMTAFMNEYPYLFFDPDDLL